MKLSLILYRVRNDCLILRVRMSQDDKQRGLSQHTTVLGTCNSELWIRRVLVVSVRKVTGLDVVGGAGIFCSPIPFFPFPPLPRTSFTAPQVAEVYWRCLNSSTVTVFLGNAKGRDNANPYDMKRKWDVFLSVAFFSD